jgi:selenocysteine-specific elongation factor
MHVIGTAGHVDHGKSTLVMALTGINPDRLKEEREREMTIDLGFAWMTLPNGELVGIVDVPGHRDFIENMLAGVGGIDAVIFVVAADEGVMPQTREHLIILDILQVQGGVIALTKSDLVSDPEWLDLIKTDVHQVVQGTVLADAPMVAVSALTGAGLSDLIQALNGVLAQKMPRPDLGRPRLPVDRVFTMPGFGTVVTGTLTDGEFHTGDEVEILPEGLRGRIRGLQSHKSKEEVALPGSRTAINITGISHEQVKRGDEVVHLGTYQPTQWLDVHFRLVADSSSILKHNSECKLFIGTSEVNTRLRLLGSDELLPGQDGWLQLELHQPVVAVRGDHYLLRRPSPGETLGGGIVVDPHPKKRHKRFDEGMIGQLQILAEGTPAELLLRASLLSGAAPVHEVVARSRLPLAQAVEALSELVASGQLIALEKGNVTPESDVLAITQQQWNEMALKVVHEVQTYLQAYPLRQGLPREQLKSRLKLSPRVFNSLLRKCSTEKLLVETGTLVSIPGREVKYSASQQEKVNLLLARFAGAPYSPPSIKDCQVEIGEELYNSLIGMDRLVQVSPDVVFRRQDYDHLLGEVRRHLETKGTLTVAEFRDRFNTSRRYALAFLEYLDVIGVTLREGDNRRLHP